MIPTQLADMTFDGGKNRSHGGSFFSPHTSNTYSVARLLCSDNTSSSDLKTNIHLYQPYDKSRS